VARQRHCLITLDTSAPSTTYLTIVPSPLVANIKEFDANETIALDLSASGDPDVAPGNDTGLQMYLFCYPQKSASAVQWIVAVRRC
jgi:hypothetical protein